MPQPLRIPAALAFTLLGALGAGAAATVASCGSDTKPMADAAMACVPCIYETNDNGNCPPPTCATGSNQDVCPEGCIPAPVG
jgi:hypothetical protein